MRNERKVLQNLQDLDDQSDKLSRRHPRPRQDRSRHLLAQRAALQRQVAGARHRVRVRVPVRAEGHLLQS